MKPQLSRRLFISSLAVSGLVVGTASAGIFSDIKDAITGHAKDAKDRLLTKDELKLGDILKSGTFDEDAVGQDAAHWAKGTASVVRNAEGTFLQLGLDFNSGPLPDGYVYYSAATDINDENDFLSTKQIEVGPLKKGNGASAYKIPHNADINSVTIWCKRFGEYIGSADVTS